MKRTYPGFAHGGRYLYPLLFLALDYAAILLAEYAALGVQRGLSLHTSPFALRHSYLYIWIPCVYQLFLFRSHTYREMRPLIDIMRTTCYALVFGALATVCILFLMAPGGGTSRLFFAAFFLFSFLFVYGERYAALCIMKRLDAFYEPVILIGAGKTAERVLRFYANDLGCRYRVRGIIDDAPVSQRLAEKYRLYGGVAKAARILRHTGVQTVIITAPGMEKEELQRLIESIQPYVRNILLVPDLIGTPLASIDTQTLFSEEILMLCLRNNLARRRNRICKRIFDLTLTITGGLLISPLLLAIAIAIKLDSRGPAFYNADRIGLHGKTFKCYKFRSMYQNSDEQLKTYLAAHPDKKHEWDIYQKIKGYDPRVTRVGAFLRRTSLDELPQILNVLKGDMSLVGPRPYLPREKDKIGSDLRTIALAKPGITGMWQTSGRSDTTFAERVSMDTWYVRNWSVWIDIMYLIKTFSVVVHSKGAY